MQAKKTSILLAMILMAVLVIPAGLVGAGEHKETQEQEVILDNDSDEVRIEKVDNPSLDRALENFRLPELNGVLTRDDRFVDAKVPGVDMDMSNKLKDAGFSQGRSLAMETPTRASDKTNNDDPWNGSKVTSNGEIITGELFMPAQDPTGDRGDYIDWYKMEFPDVNPTSTLQNITFQMNSWDSDEETLYELVFTTNAQGQIEEFTYDYVDFISVFVLFDDRFNGVQELGGDKFWYDDGDDTDGWSYDNDHPDPEYDMDNWTFNYRTPDKSTGIEDTNGGIGGLTEDGWIYFAIYYSYWLTPDAVDRGDFYIDYEFEVSWTSEQNNFPFSDSYPHGANNDLNNATETLPVMPGRVHSGLNHFDWYAFEGIDNEKIWNMSLWFNVSWSTISVGLEIGIWDWWTHIMMVWWGPGQDGVWDTDDDSWTFNPAVGYKILYYQVYQTDQSGNELPWFQTRYTTSGSNQRVNIWNINNRTDAQATHDSYLDGENPRKMFVGIWTEPRMYQQTQTGGLAQSYAHFQASDDYTLEFNVHEVERNIAPVVSDIEVTSDFPQNKTGGYYDSEFQINVTYTDENNDEPENIYLVFDDGTGAETPPIDILEDGAPIHLNDRDYTDGKQYKITFLGSDLGENPFPHGIKVWARDRTTHPLKVSRMSIPAYNNNSLFVWDDEPVIENQNWDGIRNLNEDEPTVYVPLEGFDGMFKDPENSFEGFDIRTLGPDGEPNTGDEEWDSTYESDLMTVEMGKIDGIWQMTIDLKENQYSTTGESIKIRARDLYSYKIKTIRIFVNEINDPPRVFGIKIGSQTFDEETSGQGKLDNTDPMRPVIDLRDVESAYLVEKESFEFEILAEDTDLEEDRVDLSYDFEVSPSDPWKNIPSVGYNTGIVTFDEEDITNDDVKKDNSKMVFSITDKGIDGTILLTMYFNVVNTNDEPTITIPTTTPRQYTQYQSGGIRIKPIAQDIDPGDTLSFKVNFEESIGGVDAITDQLPFMDVRKDIDWGLDPNTGEFWFKPDDQNIWNTSSGWVDDVEITLVFQVEDSEGAQATDQITLILKDLNEEPEAPKEIKADPDPSQEIYIGDEIQFWVDPVTDPDGDIVRYKWDFGDGATSEGRTVYHAYSKKGYKTVQMWVEDDQFSTEKINLRIEILEKEEDNGNGDPSNGETPLINDQDDGDDNMLLFIIAGIAALVIIAVIVVLFLVLRKKDAPAAQQYPMYDQAAMGAYGAQGLPPGQSDQLPAGGSPELPPAQAEAPQAQTEISPEQQDEAPAGNACPSCGSAVDPSWFLCPNCKSPLQ